MSGPRALASVAEARAAREARHRSNDSRRSPIYSSAHYERAATKQASKKEIRDAQALLLQDPVAGTRTSK
jgi:hypothetical protein